MPISIQTTLWFPETFLMQSYLIQYDGQYNIRLITEIGFKVT